MATRDEVRAAQAKAMTEAQLLNGVRTVARSLGWRTYHTRDSTGSEPGFPDLILLRGQAVLWRELKTEAGHLNLAQRAWLADLTAAGQDAAVWRPLDFVEGRVAAALRRRAEPTPGRSR